MATEKEITVKQGESDIQVGLESLEEWKSLASHYQTRLQEAYGPALKLVLQNLLYLSEAGAKTLEAYLESFHAQEPQAPSSEGQILRPNVPEWRPGVAEPSKD